MRVDLFCSRRGRSSGGGGGGGTERVAPDSYDVLVWYDGAGAVGSNHREEWTLPWASAGSNAEPLTTAIGGLTWRYPGIDPNGGAWIAPDDIGDASYGGALRTDATSVGESQTFTASAWIYIGEIPDTAVLCGLLGKRDDTGFWDSPYASWGLYYSQDGSVVAAIRLNDGSDTQVVIQSDAGSMPVGLHHVGLTWASRTLTLYLDGEVAAGTSPSVQSHDMAFYNHGPYFIGGFPHSGVGSGAFYAGGWASDVRVASVVRDEAWFASVWATRRVP